MMKIPYGISNFQTLFEGGYEYIDRTSFIPQLEEAGRYLVFLRPRRFGKSLFVSMLQYYYGLEHKDDFGKIFGSTEIGAKPTTFQGQYLILEFNFSGVDTVTRQSTQEGFLRNVVSGVSAFCHLNPSIVSLEDREKILSVSDAAGVLQALLDVCKRGADSTRIYVLIDEYDHFANELISFRLADFKYMVGRNGSVRKFYEVLKKGTGDGIFDRIFITGVSPITLDSLTSGFNITKSLTTNVRFQGMMGFTEKEVEGLLAKTGVTGNAFATTLQDMREWYNGYQFNPSAEYRVYNPDMVLYFLDEYQQSKEYPRQMLDINIASDYSKISQIFDVYTAGDQGEILQHLAEERSFTAALTAQFSFEKDFSKNDLISLLFYMGYLTVSGETLGSWVFCPPNKVIERLYFDYFAHLTIKRAGLKFDFSDVQAALNKFAIDNNPSSLVAQLERVITHLSNRDSIKLDEKHIKAILVSFLVQSEAFTVKSEYESERGYIDILVLGRPPYQVPNELAIELKYLPKKDVSKTKDIEIQAIEQLARYKQSEEFKARPWLKCWVFMVVGTEVRAVEC